MTITFEAETLAEAKQKITDFLNELSESKHDPRQLELPLDTPVSTPKKPKAKTKKAEDVLPPMPPAEAAQVGIDTVQLELADENLPATKEQAMESLKFINNKSGLEAATKVLRSFGCSRFSELKAEQYAPFIKAAKAE